MSENSASAALRGLAVRILGDTGDARARNATFLYISTAIGVCLLAALAGFHYALGIYWLAAVNGIVAIYGTLNALILWRGGRLEVAETALLGGLLAMISASFFGGVDATGPYWMALLPPFAFFLKGLRRGLAWVGAMVAVLLTILVLQEAGLVRAVITSRAIIILMLSLLTLSLVLVAYQALLMDAEASLAKRTQQLTREVMQRQSVEESLQRTEEKLRFTAHHDVLTGLPNRALFYDRLRQVLAIAPRSQARVGVLFAGLDNFSAVNTAHEHAGGDLLLQAAANRLQAELRDTDTVARFGGDKFAVLLWDVADQAALTAVADKLAACLARPYRIGGDDCRVGVSLGQALYPDGGLAPEALIELAEAAMHRCKREQRAGVASLRQGDLFV